MPVKVQIIFYSLYGHIWKLAEAIAEGARQVPGAEVSIYQVAETLPADVLEKMHATDAKKAFAHVLLADPNQLDRCRRHPLRFRDPLWERDRAVANVLCRDRRALAKRSSRRQGRRRVLLDRQPTRRSGNDASRHDEFSLSPRHGCRRRSVCRGRTAEHERNHRRHTVREHNDHDCGRKPNAQRKRIGDRSFSRKAHDTNRGESCRQVMIAR